MAAERSAAPGLVLMTVDTVGGVWTYALELAEALGRDGVNVALATMGGPISRAHRAMVRRLSNVEVYESRYKLEWMDDPWTDVAEAGEWLLALAGETRPDLIHLNGYAHGALDWGRPVVVVGHSCVLSWWQAVKGEPAPSSWDRYRREVARGLHAADLVIAPTWSMLSALERQYGRLRRSRVVPNGRQAAGFPPGLREPFLLSAGRLWDEAKNLASLAAVAPGLPWPTYVAGSSAHPNGRVVDADGVRSLGPITPEALAGWMARASIYVLPARYEPFGLSALEAALAGCALVLGDIESLREVWGDSAQYVAPDDREGLRDALRELIANESHRAEMADRARARAQTFTPQRMAEGYLQAYRDLATTPARSSPLTVCP